MKKVQLIHNPTAGERTFDEKKLLDLLCGNHYECRYFSTKKKGWQKFDASTDIIVAGGDGTIRKAAGEILKRKLLDKPGAIAVFPLGTANNIADALQIKSGSRNFDSNWKYSKSFDVGRLYRVPGQKFFLESYGYGLFPKLMKEMREIEKDEPHSRKERLKQALKLLLKLIRSEKPVECKVEIDGTEYSGKFLMVEVMNTPRIGPNLDLSPRSSTSDGEFEILLISEEQRKMLASYISGKLKGSRKLPEFKVLTGKNITIRCNDDYAHADDQLVEIKSNRKIKVEVKEKLLHFLSPKK
jgi:diacylglycerol kinase family enzyme